MKAMFACTIPQFLDLMNDPFGNYFTQKLVEVCSHEQLHLVIQQIGGSPVELCKSMHGTRAIQKIVEVLAPLPKHAS